MLGPILYLNQKNYNYLFKLPYFQYQHLASQLFYAISEYIKLNLNKTRYINK